MEIPGVVREGRIQIAAGVLLPERAQVRVIVEEEKSDAEPFERLALTREEILRDIAWGLSDPFRK